MTEHNQPKKIVIQFFCPRWGQEHETYDAFCRKVKEAGYDGIEAPVPFDASEREEQMNALAKYDLLLLVSTINHLKKILPHIKSIMRNICATCWRQSR